jgi:hypothetical protein
LEPFWKSLISNLLPEKGRAKTGKSQQKSQQKIEFCVTRKNSGKLAADPPIAP